MRHVLPDVLRLGLDVVFCGSAAGAKSAEVGAYYAGPGNRFWPTLHETGLTPRLFHPEEFPKLPEYGIGLTDMAKTESGADATLSAEADDPEALRAKIESFIPRILAFTAKRPARALLGPVDYGWQAARIGETRLYVLPSPSGLARRWWDVSHWRELAAAVKAGRQ